jgi:DNA-binding transcriptional regulator PaaX
MADGTLDSYALDQAYKLAQSDLASYHKARERIHREATKKLVLVQVDSPKQDQKQRVQVKKK